MSKVSSTSFTQPSSTSIRRLITTVEGYVERILDTLADAIEEQLGNVQWHIVAGSQQIVKARAILQHGIQSQVKQGSDDFWRHSSFRAAEDGFNSLDNFEMEKHSIPAASEADFVDKFVVNEEPYLRKEMVVENLDDDDEWPEDETQDENNAARMAAVLACDEEDISFSDLEEEDDCFSKQTYSRNGSKLSAEATLSI